MSSGKHGKHRRGPNHPKWNTAKMISAEGYVKIRVGKVHPLADPNGYAYEHLLVWVSAGNPRPPPGCCTTATKIAATTGSAISNS